MIKIEQGMTLQAELPTVACCMCSAAIKPNPTNMCVQCIRSQVDITEGIATKPTVYQCRGCMKWLKPGWVVADLESRELMALCLRKVSGLNKVKLVDASWIWTEAHSRRLKLKLTVQKEVVNGAILQQSFIVEFTIRNQQCVDCQASYTNNTWKAVVQIRQRVEHKRTFFYLEQLILKHNAHLQALNVQTHKDGIDFFYGERNQAARMLSFLESVIPLRTKSSKKLISADNHSNVYNFHYTYLVTILPICKDDLAILPPKLAETLGQFPRVCTVQHISSCISLVDPLTAQTAEVNVEHFGKYEFKALMSSRRLTPFIVLSSEPLPMQMKPTMAMGKKVRRARLAEVTLARESDLGSNDQQFVATSHLGHLLMAGDTVLGYDLTTANLPQDVVQSLPSDVPDVVLVRKVYTKDRDRKWKLDTLEKDVEVAMNRREREANEADYERFMQQLESDREMRKNVHLYRAFDDAGLYAANSEAGDEEQVRVDELVDSLSMLKTSDGKNDDKWMLLNGVSETGPGFEALRFDDDEDDL